MARVSFRSPRPGRSPTAGIVATVLVMVLSGCAPDAGQEVRSEASPTTVAPAGARGAVEPVWGFTSGLLRAVADRDVDANAVIAPVPVAVGLAQAAAGAGGETLRQLDRALGRDAAYDAGLGTIWQVLPDRSGGREDPDTGRRGRVSVELASSLWAQRNTRFEDPWLDGLARTWDSGVRETDFRSDPNRATGAVNEWAADATDDNITELLRRGALDELTRFLAPSAAYLKAPWATPFAPSDTRLSPFRRLDGTEVAVPMMRRIDATGTSWTEAPGWQAVSLPYLAGELEMTIVVPDDGRFREVEARLDGPTLAGLRTTMTEVPVDVSLPRVGFTTDVELTDALRTLGVVDAFDTLAADFSGASSEEPLALAGVAHQTFFAIDEEGTEAAGSRPATTSAPAGVDGRTLSSPTTPRTIVANRPFLVLVTDRDTRVPLFYGRVVAPRG